MNYPLISEYIEAIKAAEENFEQLKNLRPVLDEDGEPMFSSGNFAVVFKMKDEQTGKLHAVKCFLREQEGRAEAYRMIAEELEFVNSTFLTPMKYLDKELFVDTNASDETEFPVLLMDWVEGQTLDMYIREHIDDQYELSLLAYQFSRLAMWLMPQPFAHGDLKPDNILVKNDGTLVLVDYDGMYVPAMKGQKARELGSPDFRHPNRTDADFDEHIDDFSLASILLSLKAISLQPELLEKHGASDRLLFSEKDYRNLSGSKIMDALKTLMQDAELASFYSLFILAISQNNLSQVSFRIFNINRPVNLSTKVTDEELANAWTDEYGVKYSADKRRILFIPNNVIDYKIRRGTQVICDGAFGKLSLYGTNKSNLKSIYLPSSVNTLSKYLYGCQYLCRIIVDVENPIFDSRNNCNAIIQTKENRLLLGCQTTRIPEGVTAIADDAFMSCVELKSIDIPDSVKTIGEQAFMNCKGLKVIQIPASVKEIGCRAFNGCDIERVTVDKDNTIYDSRDNCNAIISTNDNKLVFGCVNSYIPNTITTIGCNSFECCDIKKLVIPSGITRIEGHAFSSCGELQSIVFPPSLNSIESYAFFNCKKLTTMTFSNCVSNINDWAFFLCEALNHIFIPQGTKRHFENLGLGFHFNNKLVEQDESENLSTEVTEEDLENAWTDEYGVMYSADRKRLLRVSKDWLHNTYVIKEGTLVIGDNAFEGSGFISITISDTVTSIGNKSFYDCYLLQEIAIPDSVTSIGDFAFSCCQYLKSVKLPDSLTHIGEGAFYICKTLVDIIIPNSVLSIGSHAFGQCESLKSITIPKSVSEIHGNPFGGYYHGEIKSNSKYFRVCNGNLYDSEMKTLISYNSKEKEFSLPDSVISIGESAFYDCSVIKSVNIPNSVNYIGDRAFYGCYYLQSVTIPNTVKSIGKNAFDGCHSLLSVIIPNSLTVISDGLFYYCESLRMIKIPESIKTIGDGAFYHCSSLQEISIPDSVTSLGKSAFSSCTSLKSIYLSRNLPIIGNMLFDGCSSLQTIVIPNGVTDIDNSFGGCKDLTCISIPNSVTYIGDNTFLECYSLKEIIIPIGRRNKFEKLLPYYKDLLVEQYEEENLSTEITDEDLENAWTDEYGVMYSADKKRLLKAPVDLMKYSILEGTKVICNGYAPGYDWGRRRLGAFNRCTVLTKVEIPKTVTHIGYEAFNNCSNLTTVVLPNSILSFGEQVFDGCFQLQKIVIPFGTKDKYHFWLPQLSHKFVEQIIGWNVKSTRAFDSEEIAAVDSADVVQSKYGLSVRFKMNSGDHAGDYTYIPLCEYSSLKAGETIDMKTAKLIILCREGEKDIARVME